MLRIFCWRTVVVNASKEQGFVLVASIWLTMILLLLAGLFSSYAETKFDEALKAKVRTQERVDSYTTEELLLYLLATGVADRDGLSTDAEGSEHVKLDGTQYAGMGETFFRVNDIGGLVGVNSLNNFHLSIVLSGHESNPLVRDGLLDSLYDYIDIDDDPRLSGRESAAYRVADLAPPPNDYLRTPEELRRVFGWEAWLHDNPEVDLAWFSPNWRSRLNLNTVPDDLMQHVLPLPETESELLLNARRAKPFKDFSEVERLLNMRSNLDADFYTFLPLDRVRIRIYSNNNEKLQIVDVTNTPLSITAPWTIESRYQSERHFNIGRTAGSVAAEFFSR